MSNDRTRESRQEPALIKLETISSGKHELVSKSHRGAFTGDRVWDVWFCVEDHGLEVCVEIGAANCRKEVQVSNAPSIKHPDSALAGAKSGGLADLLPFLYRQK